MYDILFALVHRDVLTARGPVTPELAGLIEAPWAHHRLLGPAVQGGACAQESRHHAVRFSYNNPTDERLSIRFRTTCI